MLSCLFSFSIGLLIIKIIHYPSITVHNISELKITFVNITSASSIPVDNTKHLQGDSEWIPPLKVLMIIKGIIIAIPSVMRFKQAPITSTRNNGDAVIKRQLIA